LRAAGAGASLYEAQLGAQATARLTELLNEDAFALAPNPANGIGGRDEDRYARKLRVLTGAGKAWAPRWSRKAWRRSGRAIGGRGVEGGGDRLISPSPRES